jgi:hypothetical protein
LGIVPNIKQLRKEPVDDLQSALWRAAMEGDGAREANKERMCEVEFLQNVVKSRNAEVRSSISHHRFQSLNKKKRIDELVAMLSETFELSNTLRERITATKKRGWDKNGSEPQNLVSVDRKTMRWRPLLLLEMMTANIHHARSLRHERATMARTRKRKPFEYHLSESDRALAEAPSFMKHAAGSRIGNITTRVGFSWWLWSSRNFGCPAQSLYTEIVEHTAPTGR